MGTRRYYLQGKTTMTSVDTHIQECTATIAEGDLGGGKQNSNSNRLNLLVNYCGHPKFDFKVEGEGASSYAHRVSFTKFRIRVMDGVRAFAQPDHTIAARGERDARHTIIYAYCTYRVNFLRVMPSPLHPKLESERCRTRANAWSALL